MFIRRVTDSLICADIISANTGRSTVRAVTALIRSRYVQEWVTSLDTANSHLLKLTLPDQRPPFNLDAAAVLPLSLALLAKIHLTTAIIRTVFTITAA